MDRRDFLLSAAATSLLTSASASGAKGSANAVSGEQQFTFPPEWGPHETVWIGWNDWVSSEAHTKLRLDMLESLTPYIPVTVNVPDEASAQRVATHMQERAIDPERVLFNIQDTVDIWVRDTGPLFISNGRRLQLAAFKWGNYGFPWPYTSPPQMARGDAPRQVAASRGYRLRTSDVVAEGGGIEVNSRSLITYRDAAMHRNPGKTLNEIETELKRLYGKEQVIWLDRAPITDRIFAGPKVANFFGWGANGHVDEYVRFVSEDTLLVAEVNEEERERDALMRLDHEILAENRRQLEEARDPDGNPFKVVTMPAPDVAPFLRRRTLTEADFASNPENGFDQRSIYRDFEVGDEVIDVPAVSYLNFLITNGVVISARYWEEGLPEALRESDARAAAILKEHFPDRDIVQINPLAANWDGGGVHCLTQQQPTLGV
jgi:agmatine deiminase